ncbi:Aste57867_4501 [Aphanomyces stellatus]|uniref:Aste57867_4501 protein n=1 Tax=Aphanomyces stellatus TaxID=120398 RepID=A0A485KCR6_9STRA|nr:hypothetical protein As57867_004488 [Aphanomyces stellatus]VFT81611.1 Aste57867_4501 [Aphanomyces stellatus]
MQESCGSDEGGSSSPRKGELTKLSFRAFDNEEADQVREAGIVHRTAVKCRIVSHTIDKKESKKFRRAIQRPYYTMFIMHVVDSEDTNTVKRTYLQFKSLHKQLSKKYPRTTIPLLPSMKVNRYDTRYIEQKYTELEKYIHDLLTFDTIASCEILRAFLDDCPLSDGSDEDNDDEQDHRESTSVLIQRGQSYSISIEIPCANAEVVYQFSTLKSDIGFSITLNDTALHMYSREESLKGTVMCPESGLCVLTWDNSYVWRRSKTVTYRAEVILPTSPVDDGSASNRPQQVAIVAPDSDLAPTGYIEQVRRKSMIMSPRRLVSRSMTKIGWTNANAFCIKAGPLILQRHHTSIKSGFTSINKWYRKWFTLDGAHGILRYYDKEESTSREGPIAKLRVTCAKTTLEVSHQQNCPTPYAFQISSGRTSWLLCAEKEEDFVAWRAALATCIFLVRWNQHGGEVGRTDQQPSSDPEDENPSDDDEDDMSPTPYDGDQSTCPEEIPLPRIQKDDEPISPPPSFVPATETRPGRKSESWQLPRFTNQRMMQLIAVNISMATAAFAPSMAVWTLLVVFNTVVVSRLLGK